MKLSGIMAVLFLSFVNNAFAQEAALLAEPLKTAPLSLQVISFYPQGNMDYNNTIKVTFNTPMVNLGVSGSVLPCPIDIQPKVNGTCRWTSSYSFEYTSQDFFMGQTFSVTIPKGTTALDPNVKLPAAVSWSFKTQAPTISAVYPEQNSFFPPYSLMFVQFSQPVDYKTAKNFIEFTKLMGNNYYVSVPFDIRSATKEEAEKYFHAPKENVIALKPDGHMMQLGQYYKLTVLKGLPNQSGGLGLEKTSVYGFLPPPESFNLKSCTVQNDYPDIDVNLFLTSRVKRADLVKHIKFVPEVYFEKPDENRYTMFGSMVEQDNSVQYTLRDVKLTPGVEYKIVISSGLVDEYGNEFKGPFTMAVPRVDYPSTYIMPRGFGILESYLPARHPFEGMNTGVVNVGIKKITPKELIEIFDPNTRLAVGTTPYAWNPAPHLNVGSRNFIDLEKTLGHDSGGLIYVEVSGGIVGKKTVVDNVTSMGLTVKSSPDNIVILATELKTSEIIPDVSIQILDTNSKVLWSGKTGQNGVAKAPGWLGLHVKNWRDYPRLWIVAQRQDALSKDSYHNGKDMAVMYTNWRNGLEDWRFNITSDKFSFSPYRALLFAERDIYLPGDIVHLKGIVRHWVAEDWAYSDIKKFQVTVWDSNDQIVLTEPVTLTAESSFSLDYKIPEASRTGSWRVTLTEPGHEWPRDKHYVDYGCDDDDVGPDDPHDNWQDDYYYGEGISLETKLREEIFFRVESFKTAEFETAVHVSSDYYVAGDTMTAAVSGWYLFGAPMNGSKVSYSIIASRDLYSVPIMPGYEYECSLGERANRFDDRLLLSRDGELDAAGITNISLPLTDELVCPQTVSVNASITGDDQQKISAYKTFIVHPADVYPVISTTANMVPASSAWVTDLLMVRPNGKTAVGLQASYSILRRENISVSRAGVHGRVNWVNESNLVLVSSGSFISGAAPYKYQTVNSIPGDYVLQVTAVDEAGRKTVAEKEFYVYGKTMFTESNDNYVFTWPRKDNDIIELVADKAQYKPGDTATILVKSPFPKAKAFITVEREGVKQMAIQELSGAMDVVKVKVTGNFAPNVYVGVVLLSGRKGKNSYTITGQDDLSRPQAKFGYVMLNVTPRGRKINTSIKTDKEKYLPGDTVKIDLKTTDIVGKPAKSEVTLYVVDDGVLALTGYTVPDPIGYFYGMRKLMVQTTDSRLYVLGQRSFGEKGKNRGGGGGFSMAGIDLRSKFVATPFYQATVDTDEQGMASLSFKLPDNLTRFRIMAVAATKRMFGSANKTITVSKPLLLKPSMPRFLRSNDKYTAGVVVHNYTGSATKVKLGMEVLFDGKMLLSKDEKDFTIPSGKTVKQEWTRQVSSTGTLVYRFKAVEQRGATDGLEWSIPIKFIEKEDAVIISSGSTDIVKQDSVQQSAAAKDAYIYSDRVKIPLDTNLTFVGGDVHISAGYLARGLAGLQYLFEYPHGCMEQKLSRILPVVIGDELVTRFNLGNVSAHKNSAQQLLNEYPTYQTPDGGYYYWPSSSYAEPTVTAYALDVAYIAKRNGFTVNKDSLAKALEWLKRYMADPSSVKIGGNLHQFEAMRTRSYVIYVLALYGVNVNGPLNNMYLNRGGLSMYSKSMLLKAAVLLKNQDVREGLFRELSTNETPQNMDVHESLWTPVRDISFIADRIDALMMAGGSKIDTLLMLELLNEVRAQVGWGNTFLNADVLKTFQNYYRFYEKKSTNIMDVKVIKNDDTPILKGEFKGGEPVIISSSFTITAEDMKRGEISLAISRTSKVPVSFSIGIRHVDPPFEKAASHGYSVEKYIMEMDGKPVSSFKAGKRYKVKVIVSTPEHRVMPAINDPIPAGFELVDTTLLTEQTGGPKTSSDDEYDPNAYYYKYYGMFNREERYDNRIAFFADSIPDGRREVSYIVQASFPGEYYMPATYIESMYNPEINGHSDARLIKIVP